MSAKKGILIVACGHPFYGKMAAALAATVQECDSTVPLHLAYAGAALKYLGQKELDLFTSKAEIPKEYYNEAKQQWIRVKMFINDLSPFEETLYLDSDLLWLKKSPLSLFEQLKKVDITFPNFNFDDFKKDKEYSKNAWVNLQDVKRAYEYKSGKYYHIHSELIYFKKCDATEKYFLAAREIYDNLKVKCATFADAVPDELPFAIACIECKMYPHESPYRPVYWRQSEKGFRQVYEIAKDYYALSMAGNQNTRFEQETYDLITSAAYLKLGLQQPYTWKQKSSFLPERKNL